MNPRDEADFLELIHESPQSLGEPWVEVHREHIVNEHNVLHRERRSEPGELRVGRPITRQQHIRTAAPGDYRYTMAVFRKKMRVLLHHPLDSANDRGGGKMHERDVHGVSDALEGGMRIVSIFIVLAIVYLLYGRNGDKQSPQSRIAEAQAEAAVQPTEAPPQPGEVRGSLRAPIDRTHQTLDLVKKRNGE